MRNLPLALAVMWTASSCAPDAEPPANAALAELIEAEWEQRLEDDPLLATGAGRHEYGARLPDVSQAALAERAERDRELLGRLAQLARDGWSEEDHVNHAILVRVVETRVRDYELGDWQIPFTSDSGFHTGFARLPFEMPFRTPADYDAYIARLNAFPEYVLQHVANMRTGMGRGMTMPRVVLEGFDTTMSTHVVERTEDSVFYGPFEDFPAGVPEAERERLLAEGRKAIQGGAIEGYRELLRFFTEEYVPAARQSVGAADLPDGRAYYEHKVRHFTTLDLTPREVHELGEREVARIRAEMEAVIRRLEFRGDFAAFLEFLRTDPRFYARTPEELLMRASYLAKRADAALPAFFGRLPRTPYGVQAVPADLAPKYTGGRYVSAAEGSGEPGWYWVNTYALESRPLYVLPALTLHEAVPGHHLQIALAAEQEDLPPFRRHLYVNAFGEGWGLYSEKLGVEMGLYDDDYAEFGRLTYEMWRACRLVVDTGLHAFGWERERAIEHLAGNTALSLHECTTEIDRYISWPGQALSYKVGELEILKLRARAEEALGGRFDVAAFHDAVLAHGTLPLDVLGRQVDRYIERSR